MLCGRKQNGLLLPVSFATAKHHFVIDFSLSTRFQLLQGVTDFLKLHCFAAVDQPKRSFWGTVKSWPLHEAAKESTKMTLCQQSLNSLSLLAAASSA